MEDIVSQRIVSQRFDVGDLVEYEGWFYPIVLVLCPKVISADYLIKSATGAYIPVLHSEVKHT